jgi:hypothetical protein
LVGEVVVEMAVGFWWLCTAHAILQRIWHAEAHDKQRNDW